MAAYRRVYDSHHLQADCQEQGSAPEPYTLGNRLWATFTFTVVCDAEHLPDWQQQQQQRLEADVVLLPAAVAQHTQVDDSQASRLCQ